MRAKKGIHLSGFQISGMIVRKCTFKKKITCANISEQRFGLYWKDFYLRRIWPWKNYHDLIRML